jgi:hypothetical protein
MPKTPDTGSSANGEISAILSAISPVDVKNALAERRVQAEKDGAGADYLEMLDRESPRFVDIFDKFLNSGLADDPRSFLARLSPTELTTLQSVQSLADPIRPESLCVEGAVNLLLPRSLSQDVDKNGMTSVGTAQTFVFPPTNAPADFKAAWEAKTANLSFAQRADLESALWQESLRYQQDVKLNKADALSSADHRYFATLVDRTISFAMFSLKFQPGPDQRANVQAQISQLRDLRELI